MQPQTFSKKISSWFSSWIQLGKHLNDSGREHTFPWVNVVNDLFCGPWPCGQSESVWNQAVMTGWGNQDTHGKTPRLSDGGLNGRLAKSEKPSTVQPTCFVSSLHYQVHGRHLLSLSISAVTSSAIQSVPFIPVATHACSIFKCTSASC